MAEAELKRHALAFLTPQGKALLKKELYPLYAGEEQDRLKEVLEGGADVPGIVRRAERREARLALGFVPQRRLSSGNRLRIAAYAPSDAVRKLRSPYELAQEDFPVRNLSMEAVQRLCALALARGITIGVIGSAGLEIATGLPYTDEASDLDMLLKPAPHRLLAEFYREAKEMYPRLVLDFEVELPNGYGTKLAELFMDGRSVLGKSVCDVRLLQKEDIAVFFKETLI